MMEVTYFCLYRAHESCKDWWPLTKGCQCSCHEEEE